MRSHFAAWDAVKKQLCCMENIDVNENSLEAFDQRVHLVSDKGPLLPCSLAVYVSGLSRARLRQLMACGKVETEKVNGQSMIVLRSLVHYRRPILRRRCVRKGGMPSRVHGDKGRNECPRQSSIHRTYSDTST